MSTTARLYAQNMVEAAQTIAQSGQQSVLLAGHTGTGKSSLLILLGKMFPDHTLCYFDCNTKDLGDIVIPDILRAVSGESECVRFVTNEELGMHHDKPIILMIDEYGKANAAVKNALARVIQERKCGSYTLHPESIVFATTNLGAEGLGDSIKAHLYNRITVIELAKPKWDEWVEWGINNGIHPTVLGWCRNNDKAFADFRDVKEPEGNDYIYHPQSTRTSFVTPRSLEAASNWLHKAHALSNKALTSNVIGTIGEAAGGDLMAFARLADQLPSIDAIKDDPNTALVPVNVGALMMVVYKVLSTLERDWVNQWMDYMVRLPKEAQGVFVNGVRSDQYAQRTAVMTNKKFTDWAMANNYLFTADKT